MVWFYERQGIFIRCETRELPEQAGFELAITEPDGTERVERFADSAGIMKRQEELGATLQHDGWQGPFGRTI
jgi:hypothetical protein